MTQFVVYPTGIIDKLNQLRETGFGCCERLFGAAVFFVAEIFCECSACSAQAEAPTLESSSLISEAGEVAFRFHVAGGRDDMPLCKRQSNTKVIGFVR